MTLCAAFACNNKGTHAFPKDAKRRKLWERALKRKNWKSSKWSKLCSDQFTSADYFRESAYTGGEDEDDQIVRFTSEPNDVVIASGGSTLLVCSSAGPGGLRPRLHWRYRADAPPTADHMLSTNDANRKQQLNGSLSIDRMSSVLAGQYQCVATVEGVGTIVSRTAQVFLAELPTLVPGPRSILATAGSPALLPCQLRSGPRLALRVESAGPPDRRVYGATRTQNYPPTVYVNVTWLKNGSPILLEGVRVSLTPSGALELDPARPHDAANYACRVRLTHAPDSEHITSESIELRVSAEVGGAGVETPPRFIATPQPLTVIEGASVTFDCAAIGNPKPEMIWLNNGAAIDLSDLDSRFYLVGSGSLRVQSARALDAGAYTCRAHNRLDSTDSTTQLEVTTAPRVHLPDGPVVHAVTRGDVTLRCEVRGRPLPTVYWLKDGELLTPNNKDIALVDGTSLRISGVLRVDAGMLQCVGVSAGGTAGAAMRLTVQPPGAEKPTNASKKQRPQTSNSFNAKSFFNSLKHNNYQTTPENSPRNILSSLVSDSDKLESTLYPDAEDLDSDEIAFAYTPTPDVYYNDYDEDVDEYEDLFHATQGLDLDALRSGNTSLVSAPKGLKAVIVKHRFVTLSWEEPDHKEENITGYVVVYRVKGSERERVMQGGPSKHEMNVASLQPNSTYLFTVLAYTEHGVSPTTSTIEVHTLSEESTHAAPTGVTAEPLGPHSVRVSWTAPASKPDTYRIHYTEADSGREQYQWVSNSQTMTTLTGLRAASTYNILVGSAQGALSSPLRVVTPSDVPAAPPGNVTAHATGAQSILVRWEAPPVRSHRGQLTGYKVRYRALGATAGSQGGKRKAESLTTPADARRAELRGLERATSYQIRVCAINSNGSGPFSEWVTASTQTQELEESGVPPQPPPLTTRAGRDWISVWWGGTEAGVGGVRVRGFALGWGLGVPDELARNLPPHAHSHVIRDLQPNSEYVISLRASNNLGLGPPVYATVRTLPPSPPGDELDELEEPDDEESEEDELPPLIPPLGLKVIMLSGTTAVVYWTDPTLAKGQTATDGRRYVVRWSSGGGRARTYNATDLNCMLDDLRPFTTYEFAVKLIKGGRESAWSMLVTNTTLEVPPASPPRDLRASLAPPGRGNAAELSWEKPSKPNGIITGYVIMYSPSARGGSGPTDEWTASAVLGDRRSARVDRLKPRTTYYFKMQARNSAGLGPFSQLVAYTTGEDSNEGIGLSGATSAWLWASAGGACAVLALAAALALSLCCRHTQPSLEPDRSTYQKSSASTGIKPPDLWIHHDQMELKHLDKSLHSSASKISAGSVDGPNALVSSTLTLRAPPAEYEPARHQHPPPASLDRRHYVPTYVDSRWSQSCGGSDSDETAAARSDSAAGTRRYHYNPMSGVGCAATCDRRPHARLTHGLAHPDQSTPLLGGVAPLGSPQSSLASLAPLHPPPAPCGSGTCPLGSACSATPAGVVGGGGDIYACAARERGHYVAYEPLGHYTHRDSLSSEAGAGGVGSAAVGSLPRHPPTPALHSFPQDGVGSVRETSPYKKSNNSSPGHLPNRLQLGVAVAHCSEELEPLTPSRSTERLHREMQNLEGLMKDLSAITQQQFHC